MAGVPRVLHVLEAVRGGTSRHVADLVRHVPAHHTVAVSRPGAESSSGAAYDRRSVQAMAEAGGRVVEVGMRRSAVHPANAGAVLALRRLLVETGADVVHGHSSVGGALARLAGASSGIPVVYTPNGVATGRSYLAAERVLAPLTDRFVAVSESEATVAVRRGLAAADRVSLVPNGIDVTDRAGEAPDLRALLGLEAPAPLVGTVARLVAQKAPARFVRVCAAAGALAPEAHFLLIGMGPLQAEVDRAVAAAGLGDRWHQIPYLDSAAAALSQLDAFVLASDFEGAPYTPLEAMRAGVAVVLSDVTGNRDVVVDGVSGVVRPPEDVEGMAEAVSRILSDEHFRRSLTDAAARRLADRFDLGVTAAAMTAIYREVAGGATRRRTLRLPRPKPSSSRHSPDSMAAP